MSLVSKATQLIEAAKADLNGFWRTAPALTGHCRLHHYPYQLRVCLAMENFSDILNNHVLVVAVVACLTAQVLKAIIELVRHRKLKSTGHG